MTARNKPTVLGWYEALIKTGVHPHPSIEASSNRAETSHLTQALFKMRKHGIRVLSCVSSDGFSYVLAVSGSSAAVDVLSCLADVFCREAFRRTPKKDKRGEG